MVREEEDSGEGGRGIQLSSGMVDNERGVKKKRNIYQWK